MSGIFSGQRRITDTPCVGVCSTASQGDEVCRGCGRTFEEVRDWNFYSLERKVEINRRLQRRQGRLEGESKI